MDNDLEQSIRTLAASHGVDPTALLGVFGSVDMPPELARVIGAVLGDIEGGADDSAADIP
jgi:hypothetical protein